MAVSFNLLFGYAGMFSFGQAAFYGFGAYATALLMNEAGLGFYVALAGGDRRGGRARRGASGAVLVRMEPIAFIMLTFALRDLLEFAAEHAPQADRRRQRPDRDPAEPLNVVVDVNGVYYAMLGSGGGGARRGVRVRALARGSDR